VKESKKGFNLYCYTFEVGFDHSIPAEKIAEIFNEVLQRYMHTLPNTPSYVLARSDGVGRGYMVYLYEEHPEDIFTLRPQIAEEVFKRWDIERTKTQT